MTENPTTENHAIENAALDAEEWQMALEFFEGHAYDALQLGFRPGKPTDNPFIESFNGSFRDECLNVNWFLSLEDAKEKIQLFKEEYNGFRPHSSLSGLTPNEVVQQHSHGPIFPNLGW